MKVIWSPLALQRMTEITDYISRDNPSAATKWAKAIFNKIENVKQFTYMGRIVPKASRNEIREIIFKNYRIIYKVGIEEISILTVRHGKQLLPLEDIGK